MPKWTITLQAYCADGVIGHRDCFEYPEETVACWTTYNYKGDKKDVTRVRCFSCGEELFASRVEQDITKDGGGS